MSPMIRVFLADDQALVRSGFRMLIDSEDDLEVVGEAPNGADAVAALVASPADVVLMDIRMPVMDGVEATRRIMAETPCAIVIVTVDRKQNVHRVFEAMGHGAHMH